MSQLPALVLAFLAGLTTESHVIAKESMSEILYYESLGATGADLCDRRLAREQQWRFERRYGKRVEALKRKHRAVHGIDPGFDIILTCNKVLDRKATQRALSNALNGFEAKLRRLEQRYSGY